jgi:hypothetical protein
VASAKVCNRNGGNIVIFRFDDESRRTPDSHAEARFTTSRAESF